MEKLDFFRVVNDQRKTVNQTKSEAPTLESTLSLYLKLAISCAVTSKLTRS